LSFAGVLGNRRFRYTYQDGFCISTDADFVITGEVQMNETKPEGPFGDHLGYYSLQHPFPVLKVHKVYARKNAIWSFTVVGRPPQEDTSFGQLIHALTGKAIQYEIPGLQEIHAVDAAGVHPLLLAIGSERYTPYLQNKQPAELLTIANHILGTGQLSLAKFLFITADDTKQLSTHHIENYLQFILQRIDWTRDIHFFTKTTIDTLDYSGEGLNSGSKVVFAAYGDVIRKLKNDIPTCLQAWKTKMIMPGVVAMQTSKFTNYSDAQIEMNLLNEKLKTESKSLEEIPLLILCDDADFVGQNVGNFLWVTFTRCNPSHDIYGIDSFTENKHWGCRSSLIIDARIKPHHAPALEKNAAIEKKIDSLFTKGAVLEKWA
jgi:4-hydroxy-3-polyprenylbenzoate decarboxylase